MVAWGALGLALVLLFGGVLGDVPAQRWLSAGLLLPLGMLAVTVCVVVLLRRTFNRVTLQLEGTTLAAQPSTLARLVKDAPARRVDAKEVETVRLFLGRDGAQLALFGREPSPLRVGLACADTDRLLGWLEDVPDHAWTPRASEATATLRQLGHHLTARPPRADGPELAAVYRAAGLWQLAADALWPRVLTRPHDREAALALQAGERFRLPTVLSLSLLQALLALHGDAAELWLDYARLCLVLKNRPEAEHALDRLDELDGPAVASHWRAVLRGKKRLPAPPSKATLGLEVNLPSHRLEGGTLVVEEQWRVGLDWFVAYRLLSGFWGPPRRLQLLDLWGEKHVLMGDAADWAARLERAAPHLQEVHDEGLLPPGTRGRIRQLRRSKAEGV